MRKDGIRQEKHDDGYKVLRTNQGRAAAGRGNRINPRPGRMVLLANGKGRILQNHRARESRTRGERD